MWRLVASEVQLRRKLAEWGYDDVLPRGRGIVLLISGPPGTGKTALAHGVAQRLRRPVLRVRTSQLLAHAEAIQTVLEEVLRVATFSGALVLVDDCDPLLTRRDGPLLALLESLDSLEGVLILTTSNADALDFAASRRVVHRIELEPPSALEREQIWEVHLPASLPVDPDIDIPVLASSYELNGAAIRGTVLVALAQMIADAAPALTMKRLREAAETQLGGRLDTMAVRSGGEARLERLVLPAPVLDQFQEVLTACRHRDFVLSYWGFRRALTTGRGICVLFDGPPGTGKTFAAEVLASELGMPIYRVQVPQIVSKWVGETERNITELFSRAKASHAILLFDEADSLFSRRTSGGQSANDRYANMEVNQVLQEIERYDGITVLTTNLAGALDDALQRRIQFRVSFLFPDAVERARIWRSLLPAEAPASDDIRFDDLGRRYELSGGHIKNALLRAAYQAREDRGPIRHNHLAAAAAAECRTIGKLVREPVVVQPRVEAGIVQASERGEP